MQPAIDTYLEESKILKYENSKTRWDRNRNALILS